MSTLVPPTPALRRSLEQAARGRAVAKFANVSCSQCGGEFGPGDAGFSHCADHTARRLNDDDFYVIDLRTKTVVCEMGADAIARSGRIPVYPGQALVKGMQANVMGLVS